MNNSYLQSHFWRRSVSENIHLKFGIVLNEERNKKFFEENQTNSLLQHLFKRTQHAKMRKLEMISGLLLEISFIAFTWNQESNYVTRTTHTSLDVLVEKHIDDSWNVDRERELSDAFGGFTRFIN